MTDEQMKYYNEGVEQGYRDGKEDLTMITRHRDSLKIEVEIKETIIEKLKKENETLKLKQKQILEDNESYQKENEELKNGSLLKELTERVKQQAEQIEKMKCCGTCKHKYKDTCYLKLMKNIVCQNKDKWELAE